MIPSINKAKRLPYRSSICDPGNRWPRVSKGIFGIRELIEIQWGTPKNATFFELDTGFDHFQEAELTKFLARDAVLRKENVLFGIEMTLEVQDAGLSLKNERECGIRIPLPDQTFQTLLVVFGRSFVDALAM